MATLPADTSCRAKCHMRAAVGHWVSCSNLYLSKIIKIQGLKSHKQKHSIIWSYKVVTVSIKFSSFGRAKRDKR